MWKLGSQTVQFTQPHATRSVGNASKTKTSSVPATPAAHVEAEAVKEAMLSAALDDKMNALLKAEEELKREKAGGYREIDFPPYNPNEPRGGAAAGGKTRLEQMMEHKEESEDNPHEGKLSEKSDPKLLFARILQLQELLNEQEMVAIQLQGENDHLTQMLEAAQADQGHRRMPSDVRLSPREVEMIRLQRDKEAYERQYQERMANLSVKASPYSRTGLTPEQEALKYHSRAAQVPPGAQLFPQYPHPQFTGSSGRGTSTFGSDTLFSQ